MEKILDEYKKNNQKPTKDEQLLIKLIEVLYEHHYREENVVTDRRTLSFVWLNILGGIMMFIAFAAVVGAGAFLIYTIFKLSPLDAWVNRFWGLFATAIMIPISIWIDRKVRKRKS